MKKRLICLCTCIALLICTFPVTALAVESSVPTTTQQSALNALYVQGIDMKAWLKSNPGMGYIYIDGNNRTMIPLRAVIETMGLDVQWDGSTQSVTINGGESGTVIFKIGSKEYSVDGKSCTMDTTPVIIEGRTHLPIRFVAESVGGVVYYNGNVYGTVAEIYYHANDVSPVAPTWADGDYVTFQRTSAYLPENWTVISNLRKLAANGEDVTAELLSFLNRFRFVRLPASTDYHYYDEGVNYEVLLIATQLKYNGYDMNLPGRVRTVYPFSVNDLSPEQSESAQRWKLRLMGAGETEMPSALKMSLIAIACPQAGGFLSNGATFDSYDPRRVAIYGESRTAFLQEKWFSKLNNRTAPDVIFFDGDCFSPELFSDAITKQSGTVMIDLDLIGSSLSLTQGSSDYRNVSAGLQWDEKTVDSATNELTYAFKWREQKISVTTGSKFAYVDGIPVDMGATAQRNSNRAYVPLAFLTKVLKVEVNYDAAQNAYFVTTTERPASDNLIKWTLGMSAVLCKSNEGNPYYFGMYNHCIRTQPVSGNSGYAYYHTYNISKGILADSWGCEDGDTVKLLATLLVENVDSQHPAWDLFRAAHLASWGYSAGYVTIDEALALVKPAVVKLRASYSSWDEATMDYLKGYLAWGGSQDEYNLRLSTYQTLKAEEAVFGVLFDDSLFALPVGK